MEHILAAPAFNRLCGGFLPAGTVRECRNSRACLRSSAHYLRLPFGRER